MAVPHISHSATLLADGRLLVAGGFDGVNYIAAAQVYDPQSNKWSAAGTLGTARRDHTATLLPSGRVLIVGGSDGNGALASAEIYDPVANTFAPTGALATGRDYHAAVVLATGDVLILGGESANGPLADVQRYDPIAGTFSDAGTFSGARYYHTATLLPSGRVLMSGGRESNGNAIAGAAVYDLGLGAAFARRPILLQLSNVPRVGLPFTLTGGGFTGDSEAASASTNSSASNYPLVNLRRLDGDGSYWLAPDHAAERSANLFVSRPLQPLPYGQYAVTMFVNGIGSAACIVSIRDSVPADHVFRDGFDTDLDCQ
jgi:hypothetical protein